MSDSRVFVSYSRADKPQVLDLVRRIESETGIRCWIDLTGVESGSQFEEVIIKAIDRSEVFLLMVSDSFLQSQWTKREVYYAESEGKRIVPISVDGKPLRGWVSFHFGHIDYIDSTSSEQVAKLCSNIRSWLDMEPEGQDTSISVTLLPVGQNPAEKKKTRRWFTPVIAAALLVAVSGLLWKIRSTSKSSTTSIETTVDSMEIGVPSPDSAQTVTPRQRRSAAPRPNPVMSQTPGQTTAQTTSTVTESVPSEMPVTASASSNPPKPIAAEPQKAVPVQAPTPDANTHGVTNGHAWVDLGTGVKWAVSNIGASKPDEAGTYYAWGELSAKNDYSWSSYKFGESSSGITKYCSTPNDGMDGFTDMITKLQPEDDIAHTEWGGNWRLPTHSELRAMISACTSNWTSRNGHEGILFTSKTTGEEVFFPAAGFRTNAGFNGVGQSGRYWSSSLNSDGSTNAWGLYFDSSKSNTRSNKRVNGFTVRPVTD